jgi:hypothetical protein
MKIIFTIEDDLNASLEMEGIDMFGALDIIKDAQEEMYLDRISLN